MFFTVCSFQAVVTIQDSRYEVRRLLLLLLSNSAHQRLSQGSLQEQERQREAERRRQELARVARDRQLWARECQAQQQRYEERESRLTDREQQCHEEAQRLQRQREELEEQQQEYQQSLERLREGQRSVEREREKLELQQKMVERWKHERQRSLPVTSMEGQQGSGDGTKVCRTVCVTFVVGLCIFPLLQLLRWSLGVCVCVCKICYSNKF